MRSACLQPPGLAILTTQAPCGSGIGFAKTLFTTVSSAAVVQISCNPLLSNQDEAKFDNNSLDLLPDKESGVAQRVFGLGSGGSPKNQMIHAWPSNEDSSLVTV